MVEDEEEEDSNRFSHQNFEHVLQENKRLQNRIDTLENSYYYRGEIPTPNLNIFLFPNTQVSPPKNRKTEQAKVVKFESNILEDEERRKQREQMNILSEKLQNVIKEKTEEEEKKEVLAKMAGQGADYFSKIFNAPSSRQLDKTPKDGESATFGNENLNDSIEHRKSPNLTQRNKEAMPKEEVKDAFITNA